MNAFASACILSTAALAVPANARAHLADVSVIDRNTQQVLPLYYSRGTYWVAGNPGARYALRIRNTLGERILAVTSVDGVNVISGETAGLQQTGYVFGPYGQYEVTGWRKSDTEIAAFEFTHAAESYAGLTGRAANVGVLGVAVFRERPVLPVPVAPMARAEADVPRAPPPLPSAEPMREFAPGARASAMAAPATGPLGTGHGARETSVVSHTAFERLSEQPDEIIRIRYDSYDRLVAMGVIRRPVPPAPGPDPFPNSPQPQYVPDPPR